jgi:histidine triad (HIT) family protein
MSGMSMSHDENCLFCKIATGKIPSKKVYEDADTFAFHDINPAAPVHFLIIPKSHVASLNDCNEGDNAMLGKLVGLAPRLAQEQGAVNGFKTLINTGVDGGQEVYHLHVHVIGGPRPWKGQR